MEAAMASESPTKLSELLDEMVEGTNGDKVSLGDLLDTVESRSFGPLLVVPALIAASPIGAVPGMSVITGSMIILLAGQLVAGRRHPWLPQRIRDFEFDRERLTKTRKKLRPWLKWAERPIQARLTMLVEPPADRVIAVICIALSLLFYPLALVPFGVFLPSVAILFFGVGLSARDGLLTLFAFGMTAATVWAAIAFWPF
ncbi:exopolysaccharide biosynthesis protein [Botrimarina mediterranea]|uniref:Exopolysaccharide synthesis, ExoD n=1 Tax=Botrimarina mediterranea TaxID=2528022 RepID=A0A518KCT2_9BACT|nr:exopolysaccharide biosynthesis protein [Botrimarina mediterranea]QDV75612.1 Exopolysaccharide synthesis, ExoD [Botrimarina mediterranea]QDV80247.1 Exopolysaccharide synthesis, ExoD [Planctomycetes bacterium K2D]